MGESSLSLFALMTLFLSITVDPWTSMGLGHWFPCCQKSACIFILLINVSTLTSQYLQGIGSSTYTPRQISKSADVQVPYMKWSRTMNTMSPPHLQIPIRGQKILFLIHGYLNPGMQIPGVWGDDCRFVK